jgi:arylsulfatase
VATGKQGPWELYDMRRDRAEQHNLIQDQPARAAQMAAQWESFDAGIVKTRESSPAVSTKPLV